MPEDILTLRDEKSHLIRSCEDLLALSDKEGRILSDDEKTKTSNWMAEAKKLDERIAAIEDHDRRAKEVRDEAEKLRARGHRVTDAGQPNNSGLPKASTADTRIIPVHRYGKLKAFKGEDADFNAYASGQWLIATLFPQTHPARYKADRFCKENGVYQQILDVSLTTAIPASGGSLVPTAMSQAIIDLRETYGIFRQWCEVMPMSSDSQIVPRRVSSPTATFTGEGVALTQSEPTWNNVQLTAKKLGILSLMSNEVSDDAIINLTDYLTKDMAWAFALKEDTVGFNGTGISTDGNIVGVFTKIADGSHNGSFITVPTATHNTFAELDATDLITLMAACPQYARPGSAWFCSQVCADAVFGRLKAAGGGNTISTLALAGITKLGDKGVVGEYLGYPIVASQVLPSSTGALTNAAMLAFGNLAMCATLGERRGITFATSSDRYFETDQLAIKATSRIDINAHDCGDGSTAGPFVVLKGGSS